MSSGSRTTARQEIEQAIRDWRAGHTPGTVEKYPRASVALRIAAVEEVLAAGVAAEEALRDVWSIASPQPCMGELWAGARHYPDDLAERVERVLAAVLEENK